MSFYYYSFHWIFKKHYNFYRPNHKLLFIKQLEAPICLIYEQVITNNMGYNKECNNNYTRFSLASE